MRSTSGLATSESEAVRVEYGADRIKVYFEPWAFRECSESELAEDISATFTEARFDREDAIRELLDSRRGGEPPRIPAPDSPEGLRRAKYFEAAQDIEITRRSARGFFNFRLWGDGDMDLSILPKLFSRGDVTLKAFHTELEANLDHARRELSLTLNRIYEQLWKSA